MAEDIQKQIFRPITGGMNTAVPPTDIGENQSPLIENLVYTRSRLEVDFGYTSKGDTIRGVPRIVHHFKKKTGASEILVFTNATGYRWKAGEWQYIPEVATTINHVGGYAAGSTSFTVTSAVGFAVDDYIGCTLDDGSEHQSTIVNVSGSDIEVADGIPVGRTLDNGDSFIKALELNGVDYIGIDVATFPAGDVVIMTNGKDNIKAYDGSTCIDVPNLVTAVGGGNCYAKVVRVKDNRVILFNLNEAGTDLPQRVRWSAVGDYTDWTTTDDAGFEDLYGDYEHIITARQLGPYMMIYKESFVYRMEYVGTAALIYNFVRTLDAAGAIALHAVINRGDHHIVMGKDSFYMHSGGYSKDYFGEEIYESLFGRYGNISGEYKRNITASYIEDRRLSVFLIPTAGVEYPNLAYIYDSKLNAWTTRRFEHRFIIGDDASSVTAQTWAESVGDWEDTAWQIPWNDLTLITGDTTMLFCGLDSSQNPVMYEYIADYTTDDGTLITGKWRSPEVFAPFVNIRTDRIKLKAKGDKVVISYSTDGGDTWNPYGVVEVGSDYATIDVYKQVVSEQIMFEVSGTSLGFEWMLVEFSVEDEE